MKVIPKYSSLPFGSSLPEGTPVVYENNNVSILGVITAKEGAKYSVINQKGDRVHMQPIRLYPLPGHIALEGDMAELSNRLEGIFTKSMQISRDIELEELWLSLTEDDANLRSSVDTKEMCELYFGNNEISHHLAMRLALTQDKVYFKRKKDLFYPRSEEAVGELKKALQAERRRCKRRLLLAEVFSRRLSDINSPLNDEIAYELGLLEDLAGGRIQASKLKEAKELLEFCMESLKLDFPGSPEQKSLNLLMKLRHFTPDVNLSLIRYRPPIEFKEEELEEAARLVSLPPDKTGRKDLTGLFTFTIDDASTKDMDDALSLEETEGGYRLGVHISDAAGLIEPDSVLDREAKQRATSIYCPETNINMLPEGLCTDRLSLRVGSVRECLSCIFEIDSSFHVKSYHLIPSLIKVQRKFSYDEVDHILESGIDEHARNPSSGKTRDCSALLSALYSISGVLEVQRIERGAMKVSRRDVEVIVKEDGAFELVNLDENAPARRMIGEMMILVNAASAEFAAKNGLPLIFRGQRQSENDGEQNAVGVPPGPALDYALRMGLGRSTTSTSPESHAMLGLSAYAQVTSPIRRFSDLCNQRQLKAFLQNGSHFYTKEKLDNIKNEIDEPMNTARVIARESKRYWLLKHLMILSKEGRSVEGVVVRDDLKIPIVEIGEVYITVPLKLSGPVKPGDKLNLKIIRVDPHSNYLKLEKI